MNSFSMTTESVAGSNNISSIEFLAQLQKCGETVGNTRSQNEDLSSMKLVTEKRDIILENDINTQRYCMPSIEVRFRQEEGQQPTLFFSDLIDRLKQMNFPLNNCMLFCWDDQRKMHVFIANDPIGQPYFLPAHLCSLSSSIYIKFRSFNINPSSSGQIPQPVPQQHQQTLLHTQRTLSNNFQNQVHFHQQLQRNDLAIKEEDHIITFDENTSQMCSEQQIDLNDEDCMDESESQKLRKKKRTMMNALSIAGIIPASLGMQHQSSNTLDKRVKERYIENVREKVAEWRAMHEIGLRNKDDGQLVKINLDQAANNIGISRKTLDDYFLQLRRAEQYGFDFEKNKSEKMGTLRKFVKDEYRKQSKKNGGQLTAQQNGGTSPANNRIGFSDDEADELSSDLVNGNVNNSNNNISSNNNQNGQQSGFMFSLNANATSSNSAHRGSSNNLTTSSTKSQTMPSISNAFQITPSSVNVNKNSEINHHFNQSNPLIHPLLIQNQQLHIQSQQPNHQASILTPFNYNNNNNNNNQQFYSPNVSQNNQNNSLNTQSQPQNGQVPNEFGQPSISQYLQSGFFSNQDPSGRGSLNMNQANGTSMGFASQIFNTSNQFHAGNSNLNIGSNFSAASVLNPNDFTLGNHIVSESINGSNITPLDQARFSQNFSLFSFGNSSQFVEERNSLNFLTQISGVQNNSITRNNIITVDPNRVSTGSTYHNNEDNYISTTAAQNRKSSQL